MKIASEYGSVMTNNATFVNLPASQTFAKPKSTESRRQQLNIWAMHNSIARHAARFLAAVYSALLVTPYISRIATNWRPVQNLLSCLDNSSHVAIKYHMATGCHIFQE